MALLDCPKKNSSPKQTLLLTSWQMATCSAFIGASKPRNRGILYQINTAVTATWLKNKEVEAVFFQKMGGTSILKACQIYVVVEFIPTTFDVDSGGALQDVE